jgi:hypothetical protein
LNRPVFAYLPAASGAGALNARHSFLANPDRIKSDGRFEEAALMLSWGRVTSLGVLPSLEPSLDCADQLVVAA